MKSVHKVTIGAVVTGAAVVVAGTFFAMSNLPLQKHLTLWSDVCQDQKSAACKPIEAKDEKKGTPGPVLENRGTAQAAAPVRGVRRKLKAHHGTSIGSAISCHTCHSNPRTIRPHPKKAKKPVQGDQEEVGPP